MDVLADRILGMLEAKFGQRPTLEDPLAFIGVDSITMAELTVELEKAFDIKVDDDVVQLETVGELVAYVRDRTDNGSASTVPGE
ncbi:MAG: acyl carrier protein [Planctomycetota bacterium]|nr:MAG: acyl carrier protein [Planctomycetota bacterium]